MTGAGGSATGNDRLGFFALTRRHTLGDNHPHTLVSAINIANALRALGDHQAARDLHHDTLTRCRHTLGNDHTATLRSATNLAVHPACAGRAGTGLHAGAGHPGTTAADTRTRPSGHPLDRRLRPP